MKHRILDFLTLRKAAYRWLFIGGLTVVLYVIPYDYLEKAKLSLYERLNIPAPSIGLTRAYWKFIHGDFAGAWERNKIIYAVLLLLIILAVKDMYDYFKRRR